MPSGRWPGLPWPLDCRVQPTRGPRRTIHVPTFRPPAPVIPLSSFRETRRAALGLGLATLAGWLGGAAPAGAAPAARGEPVRWPTVRLLDGQRLDAEAWRGQAMLVVFFDTGCAYCQRHNLRLDKLMRASAGLPLRALLAAHDRSAGVVQAYLQRHALQLPATLDSDPLHEALTLRRYQPLTCAIDRQGVLREVIPGEMAEDDVMELARWARS